jgi:TIR domain
MGADAVFISYSHDSPEHSARVLALSDKLRAMGVDAELDQYHTRPPQGWPQWCEEQLRPKNSKFVLLICTEIYRDRVENQVPADEGRGVYWEGAIVYNYVYKAKANERFLPVLFGDESRRAFRSRCKASPSFASVHSI